MKIKNNTPFQVVVNGQTFDVQVEDTGATPLVVSVNGNPYSVELVETAAPVANPAAAAVPAPAPQKAAAPQVVKPATAAPATAGGFAINAPMPGTVSGICVKVGQAVKTGDQLCLLEAMKMKNAIRTPRDGTIDRIETFEDQKVTFGAPLFTLK